MKVSVKINEVKKIYRVDTSIISSSTIIEIDDSMQLEDLFDYKYIDGKLIEISEKEKDEYKSLVEKASQTRVLNQMMAESQTTAFFVNLPDEEAIKIPLVFPAWDSNSKEYKKDDRCQYNGKLYKVLQAHTSQNDWTPDTAVSLFVEVADPSIEYPDFKQPTGAHDAYNTGDKVTFNGKHYICKMDACTWSPSDYPAGWELVED